jgi:hypothetical protein
MMNATAIVLLTSVTQPATGTGGDRARGRRELVRSSLRAVPGPSGPSRRRWA